MMFEKKRVYVLVKTYPTISEKYSELVCTAGVCEDGSWIRIYPMPYRLLAGDMKYSKYTWIDIEVERNISDFRPESYRPNIDTIKVETKPKKINWDERRKIIFKEKNPVFTNLDELVSRAKSSKKKSLAMFKPTRILGFDIAPDDREWNIDKIAKLHERSKQRSFFKTMKEVEKEFALVKKLPYKFRYHFEDDSGKESRLMISDWEIGMLFFNTLNKANGDEKVALSMVRKKYFEEFLTRDIYFFLGTTKEFHNIAPNPFIITGVFYPPMPEPYQQLGFDF